ncbi:MAG: pyridoxal-phosphate dependent enzyme [Firmicutes bacterium]|nr:pyridoxal-phosphate dependent enzyme [Bacillota bacterium]MCL1953528.1 pyridoxal-phosphate dependent enzyme [Bacillota bacterium]
MNIKINNNILELVGNTPILNVSPIHSVGNIFAKLESFNPTHSIYDRIALGLIENALFNQNLFDGGTVLDAVDNEMGVSLAMVCAVKGLNCVLIVPQDFDQILKNRVQSYGAKIEIVNGGIIEAIKKARSRSMSLYRGAFVPSMVGADVLISCCSLIAQEIWRRIGDIVDTIVLPLCIGVLATVIIDYYSNKNSRISFVLASGTDIQKNDILDIQNKVQTHIVDIDSIYDSMQELGNIGISAGIMSSTVYSASKQLAQDRKNHKNILALFAD